MTFPELIAAARTCRRFKGSVALTEDILTELVDMARLSPSARNAQPLRYALVCEPSMRERLFDLLTLGGTLRPEQRATEAQRPGGYIVILGPHDLSRFGIMDIGIAAQSIQLAAVNAGLGACMVGAFNKNDLHALLNVPSMWEAMLVIALGVPDEERRITTVREGKTGYFRDENDVHCVPKRPLDELIIIRC